MALKFHFSALFVIINGSSVYGVSEQVEGVVDNPRDCRQFIPAQHYKK